MASKVLVKIPAVNFSAQVGKCNTELVGPSNVGAGGAARITLTESNAPCASDASENTGQPGIGSISSESSTLRIAQLEQNIRFLKEQHHIMLTSLHQEVENLRQRNRDLQFQLVFSRGNIALVKSTPSSPEDDSKSQILLSPKEVNVTPLQIEILERDVAELRTSVSEARTQNAHLQTVIDEQQKRLESAAKATICDSTSHRSNSPDPDLTCKLEEAEKIIRRLRRENEEQRRELAMMKANQHKVQVAASGASSHGHIHHRGANHWGSPQQHRDYHQHQNTAVQSQVAQHAKHMHQIQPRENIRFPPLASQKYWHSGNNGRRWNHTWDSGRGVAGPGQGSSALPVLPNPSNPSATCSSAPTAPSPGSSSHGGGRRGNRGNFRGDRGGASKGHWDRDRYRDQGFNQFMILKFHERRDE